MEAYTLYYLSDPRDPEKFRYIGITKVGLKKRLNYHITDKNKTHKTNWIKSIKKVGVLPIIEIIEENLTTKEAIEKEVQYIKLLKSLGAKLTNTTNGGEGTSGYKMSEEQIQKNRERQLLNPIRYWKNKKRSQETKDKISKRLKELRQSPNFVPPVFTEESIKKIIESSTGRKKSKEQKEKMKQNMKGNKNGLGWKPTESQLSKMKLKATEAWERIRQEKLIMIF